MTDKEIKDLIEYRNVLGDALLRSNKRVNEKDKIIDRLLEEIKQNTDRNFYEHCLAKTVGVVK